MQNLGSENSSSPEKDKPLGEFAGGNEENLETNNSSTEIENPPNKKNKKGPKPLWREWLDAALIALIAAALIRTFLFEAFTIPSSSMEKSLLVGDYVFVSKLNYGIRLPMTPISFPFTHHSFPNGTQSYSEAIKWDYRRIWGFQSVKRNDVLVFNSPREKYRPVDKRENFIKRCVGLPGDTLNLVNRKLLVNGEFADKPQDLQFRYLIRTNGEPLNKQSIEKLGITEGGPTSSQGDRYSYILTEENYQKIRQFENVVKIQAVNRDKGIAVPDQQVFPRQAEIYPWNIDNFGPLIVPKKGWTVPLDSNNIHLYDYIITSHEGHELNVEGAKIFIDGQEVNSYTFAMDYYYMMGDNRHNSEDSRYWGFVPENHVVGKAIIIWFSKGANRIPFFERIRWERIFTWID